MKRFEMIKEKKYFNNIIRNGKYIKNKHFVVYYVYNNENKFPHFGIAIKNSVGSAVIRNKLKRQARSIIDSNKKLFKKDRDYIIMIRKDCLDCSYQHMNESLLNIMKGQNNEKK